jgi:hypothetical protein
MPIFSRLFAEPSGQLIVANLYTAMVMTTPPLLTHNLVLQFATAYDPAAPVPGPTVRAIAERIVFDLGLADRFQLAGPKVRPPRGRVINIRPLSRVHAVLEKLYCKKLYGKVASGLPPVDKDVENFRDVERFKRGLPDDPFGDPLLLQWVGEPEGNAAGDIDWLLNNQRPTSDEAAKRIIRVMNHFGLKTENKTAYLITEFNTSDWGTGSSDHSFRRPTAFDGIDCDYFKQRYLNPAPVGLGWNKTVDLSSLETPGSDPKDGIWEAVGRPLAMGRIKRQVFARSAASVAVPSCEEFVERLEQVYSGIGTNWPQLLAHMVVRFCPMGTGAGVGDA